MATQVSKALLVRLGALPGREDDVRGLLIQGLSIVEGEPKTVRCEQLDVVAGQQPV